MGSQASRIVGPGRSYTGEAPLSACFWQCHCQNTTDSGAAPVQLRPGPTKTLGLRIHAVIDLAQVAGGMGAGEGVEVDGLSVASA